jgi:aminoglycoside phosphotransferase (APT) family kinase protein
MHDAQVVIAASAVRAAIDRAMPAARALPLRLLESDGTINAVFRLGDEYVVRVPFIEWGANDAAREAIVLPRMAGELPVDVPELVLVGEARPELGLPWAWTVTRWLRGERVRPGAIAADARSADAFADALTALHALGADESSPSASAATDPSEAADAIEAALRDAGHLVGGDQTVVWRAALDALGDAAAGGPAAGAARTWIHADPTPGNLLVDGGRLRAVIDWSSAGIGDPAHDLIAAWWVFGQATRRRIRSALSVDDATWARARVFAWRKAAMAVGYYEHTNRGFSADARFAIAQLVDDPVE